VDLDPLARADEFCVETQAPKLLAQMHGAFDMRRLV
jgi:hypothetical protein